MRKPLTEFYVNKRKSGPLLQMFDPTYCEGSLASIERRRRGAHDDHAVSLSIDRLGEKVAEEGWESPLLHPRTCLLIFRKFP